MRELRKMIHICGIQFMRTATEAKGLALFLIVPIIIWSIVQPVADMSFSIGKPVTLIGIAFVFSDMYGTAASLLFSLGVMLLFCDALFCDEQQLQCLVRCRAHTWISAQLLYVAGLSAVYVVYWLMSMVFVIAKNLDWQLEWGTVWNTLARTNAASQLGVSFECPFGLIRHYEPLESLLLSMLCPCRMMCC